MRGKVEPVVAATAPPGITPAHAGKSRRRCRRRYRPRDHPRACGEKQAGDFLHQKNSGSPPRMRGKAKAHLITRLALGITPAHAGKRSCCACRRPVVGDHPRACGEKAGRIMFNGQKKGSPPRMRGKGKIGILDFAEGGITPAHAGKSLSGMIRTREKKDHPRACGEKSFPAPIQSGKKGSPPRMRGKVLNLDDYLIRHGITPAHAGKRHPFGGALFFNWDHPRACGEKSIKKTTPA